MTNNRGLIAALTIIGVAAIAAPTIASGQIARPDQSEDNHDLAQLYAEDQADRMPTNRAAIDWQQVTVRDRQRFGTQSFQMQDQPVQIRPIEPGVTDDLRRELNVPPLTDAQKAVLTRP